MPPFDVPADRSQLQAASPDMFSSSSLDSGGTEDTTTQGSSHGLLDGDYGDATDSGPEYDTSGEMVGLILQFNVIKHDGGFFILKIHDMIMRLSSDIFKIKFLFLELFTQPY